MKFAEPEIEAERLEAERNKLKWKERQLVCPVCRVPMTSDIIEELRAFKGPMGLLNVRNDVRNQKEENENSPNTDIVFISDKMRAMQIKMRKLYEKQKQAGGIIENNETEIIVLNVSLN